MELINVTDVTVKVDPETGAATVELRGVAIAEPRFRLRDTATEKYLTRRGWSKTPAYLPGEAVTAADFTALVLDADLARRIGSGATLVLEQPTANVFANLAWPVTSPAVSPVPEAQEEPQEEPQAEPLAERQTDAPDPAEAPAAAAAAVEEADRPAAADAPGDGTSDGTETLDPHGIPSLEPAIRDEQPPSGRVESPVLAAVDRSRETASDDDLEDDDVGRMPWGRLAVAAVAFMLLGAVLTYFWQEAAYNNELRTAMRAVEAQRDEIKADLEKRLAAAQADAGKATSASVAAADAKVASLTDQTAALAKDRDVARAALAEQQVAVKTLQERLATAEGEVESLKQAAEADATEQSAVFNERIETLSKDLDTARTELERSRAEISSRDQSVARSGEELKKAQAEIAALKADAENQKADQEATAQSRISALSAQLDKAVQDLATRDQALRDVQAKLSVANVQIEALKQVAGKATEADLEKSTLADRISDLTAQIDKADKDLAAQDAEIRKLKTSLDAANALASTNAAELEKLKTENGNGPESQAANAAGDQPRSQDRALIQRLTEERDLYSEELSAMTKSFNALKAERDRLAGATVGGQQQASLTEMPNAGDLRSVWGATAIDQTGAIYSLQNQTAEKTATDNVVALCRGKSNGRCEALKTYESACFSLARIEGEGPRNDNFGFAVEKNWKNAEAAALRQCEELGGNCTVRFTACSPDTLSKPVANN
jgi:predicted  nucleic acid-binding Zn-ribbon protein